MSSASVRHVTGVAALLTAGVVLGLVSCGSRTGLFAPELGTTGDAGANEAPVDATVPCIPGRFTFELALTQLMFVIDRSRSMAFTLDGEDGRARDQWRWSVLEEGLRRTILPFDQQIAMGAKFFPETIAQADIFDSVVSCQTDTGVAIAPRRGNAASILSVFDTSSPRGGTPTSDAVRIAAQYLTQSRGVARTLVLATDGAPNCNGALNASTCVCTSTANCSRSPNRGRFSCLDDTRTIGTIRVIAEEQRIPVYVIGIGSTERPEFLQVLDDMAVAGGRPRPQVPRHYSVQSAQDLTNALEAIRDSVAKCTYLTPSAPVDPDKIIVEIEGRAVGRDQLKQDGWDWVDKPYGELAFFGDACARAQSAAASVVAGVVSCGDE